MAHRATPRFVWQGVLIILPALLLAAMGLIALRQDRALARMEAEEQASRFLSDLGNFVFPPVINSGSADLALLRERDASWRLPSTPDREALSRLSAAPLAQGLFET